MRLNSILCSFFIAISWFATAQLPHYLIFFKDKPHAEEMIEQPEDYLSPASIERRGNQSIAIDTNDVPIYSSYITTLKEDNIEILGQTKWLNGIVAQMDDASVDHVMSMDFVRDVQLLKGNPGGQQKIASMTSIDADWEEQFRMLGIEEMHATGLYGQGVTIALMDGGFTGTNTLEGFSHLDIGDQYDFVNGATAVFDETDHGTSVLSLLAWKTTNHTGAAPDARYYLYQTEDMHSESPLEEVNWIFAAERADSLGVDIINTSLGYYLFDNEDLDYSYEDMDGRTALISKAADIAVGRGITVVASAGNTGNSSWNYIVTPADAHDVLTVGAINRSGNQASFSANGPSADGRIKPDLVAIGANTAVVNQNGDMVYSNGTSFSAPLVTGFVAGLRQKFPDMNVYDLNDTIRSTAQREGEPDFRTGYGIPYFPYITQSLEQQHSNNKMVQVVPNPVTRGQLTINIPDDIAFDIEVSVYTTTGQEVFKGAAVIEGDYIQTGLDVQQLLPGVYIVNIASKQKEWKARFQKI